MNKIERKAKAVQKDLRGVIQAEKTSRVENKRESYRLFLSGGFGNSPQSWPSLDALYASNYTGLVTVRYAQADRPFTAAHIPFKDVPARVAEWVKQGADVNLFRPNESMPDDKLTMQGEWVDAPECGDYLRYSTVPGLSMRKAMVDASLQHATHARALWIIQHYMNKASLEDFYALRTKYPDSVIEFSCYSVPVGGIPRRNTVFWEVRNF